MKGLLKGTARSKGGQAFLPLKFCVPSPSEAEMLKRLSLPTHICPSREGGLLTWCALHKQTPRCCLSVLVFLPLGSSRPRSVQKTHPSLLTAHPECLKLLQDLTNWEILPRCWGGAQVVLDACWRTAVVYSLCAM